MATTRLMPLHTGKGRTVGQAISDIIDYTENPQKTDGGRLITSWQCDSRIADAEFLFTKNQYIQKTGRVRGEDNVIAYHLRQSFVPGEITPEDANRLGCELAKRFTKGNHAYIVCTHIDKAHIHNHVIWNSTALSQTRKFRNFWGSSRAVRRLNDTICIENGYSIVENPKRHGKSYNKWLGDKKKPSHRERICAAIDDALAQKPDSFEALLELLRQAGYEVKGKKVPSLLDGEQKKSIRILYGSVCIFGLDEQTRSWLTDLALTFPVEQTLRYALIFIIILDPASVFVKKLSIYVTGGTSGGHKKAPPVGSVIGKLERILTVTLVLCNQIGAIGFVLTAKSLARYKQLDNQNFAEKYLVGTLSSTTIAIIAALLLK